MTKYSNKTKEIISKLAIKNNIVIFDNNTIESVVFELLEVIVLDMKIDIDIKASDLFNDNVIKILKPLIKQKK